MLDIDFQRVRVCRLICEMEPQNGHLWLCPGLHRGPAIDRPACGPQGCRGRYDLSREDLAVSGPTGRSWRSSWPRCGAGDVVVVTKLDRLGPLDPGAARPDRPHQQGRRVLPVAGRPAVGYRELARSPAVDDAGRHSRIRARADPRTHWRGSEAGHGAGVKFGRKRKLSDYQRAEAVKRRAAGETLAVDRQELRGRYLDDLAAGSVRSMAERADGSAPGDKRRHGQSRKADFTARQNVLSPPAGLPKAAAQPA